ncbi:alpha/beta fold hydrolase [Asticcacaulis sp.]|uniref:alpha/beta fold hydrolase n=1 Tax=Asticcacaulis sp. TaxID=1872648 RepID=UPI002BCED004|nr:alpha/beta fold hydrolase [Asticcacaulis sp.]HTM81364.1 alpha/beta fold hydrolase [Asticcacaulis sp.]
MKSLVLALALMAAPLTVAAQTPTVWPTQEGDYVAHNFRFGTGESLPDVKLHYTTLGQPHRNAQGEIDNAVMVLHGTGGSGKQFLTSYFADELYGPGQPLDIRKYYIILPDNIGHGGSSKPSDGLHMTFPKYDYDDMIEGQRRMLTEGLGVKHLRLIIGTSMGCMHIFVWGEKHPDFASALMPLACEPVEIAGLNRMWRQMIIDGIEADPAWMGGEYKTQPLLGLRTASSVSVIAGAAPLNLQMIAPTRDQAIRLGRERVARDMAGRDANDMIYQFDSSRNYNPWVDIEKITVPTVWINSADDFINPRNFDFPAQVVKRNANIRFRLIPETTQTNGHGTHTRAVNWKADLVDLLERTGR